MNITADFTPRAIIAVGNFLKEVKGDPGEPTALQMQNAMLLASKSAAECAESFRGSAWHCAQPCHSFEALVCRYAGMNHRYPPLTLNLHFAIQPGGGLIISIPGEMPLKEKYFVSRVIADAQVESKASAPDGV